jgi:hypothetical protein
MKVIPRVFLGFVFLAAIGLALFLLTEPRDKETWVALTGVLAVIAAIISAWPSIRVLEIQEDATRPRPTPHFDITSRYGLLQLRVKNLGAGVAYDVRLKWNAHPQNEEGQEVSTLDTIPVLLPQESVSVNIGRPHILFNKYPKMSYGGVIEFKDLTRKCMKQEFICNADEHRSRLTHDDEMPRTLYDLQKIPRELEEIRKAIIAMKDSGN